MIIPAGAKSYHSKDPKCKRGKKNSQEYKLPYQLLLFSSISRYYNLSAIAIARINERISLTAKDLNTSSFLKRENEIDNHKKTRFKNQLNMISNQFEVNSYATNVTAAAGAALTVDGTIPL